jgi:hypothetical protein
MADFTVRPSKAPNLLGAPVVYDRNYSEQSNNALRLYFSQIDNFTGQVGQQVSSQQVMIWMNM